MAKAFESERADPRASDAASASAHADHGQHPHPRASSAGELATTGQRAAAPVEARHDTGRVLLVGEPLGTVLQPRIAQCAPEATVRAVPSFLFAMGEAAHQPAEVVVACADALVGMAESAARSLRELLPGSRLVVIANTLEGAQEADAAVRGGFDLRLDEPISDETLRRALGRGEADQVTSEDGEGSRAAPARSTTASTRVDTGTAAVRPASPLERSRAEGADGSEASAPDSAAPASPAPASAAEAPVAEPDALGDVDLVEALLGGRDRLEPLAVRLIAQRSGLAGLGWHQDGTDDAEGTIPAHHVCAPVTHRGRRFGLLHAPPPAAGEALAGWAGWLGRWLALGEHLGRLETLAMTDELTGTWNRRYFNRFLLRILEQAQQDRSQVTLLVFDIDDFKCYNDRYGHGAGDEILREAAKLMRSFVREQDVVARIGGDEFAVIFWDAGQKRRPDSAHPHTVREAAERFQKAICAHHFPKLLDEAPGTLTISGGLASYPWDGRTPEELLERADQMALQSKNQGKNAITFGPGAMRMCDSHDAAEGPGT